MNKDKMTKQKYKYYKLKDIMAYEKIEDNILDSQQGTVSSNGAEGLNDRNISFTSLTPAENHIQTTKIFCYCLKHNIDPEGYVPHWLSTKLGKKWIERSYDNC